MPRFEEFTTIIDKALRRLESALEIEAADLEGDFIDPGSEDFDPTELEIKPEGEVVFQLPRCDDGGISLTTYSPKVLRRL